VFLLWVLRERERGGRGVCSRCVPQVLKCVLKDVSNNTSFLFSYCLAMVHGAVEGRGGEHDKACFYFGERSIFRLLYWGIVPMFQKYWSWAKQMTPLGRKKQEKKKKKGCTTSLMNRIMNKYPQFH